ncbi:phosphatase PAP2 family protein [Thermoactinospora rubra]|uniref:phosphatase PAP2 family protein n=1 Tax=Thermoactinospora rubra TaxID=1088767 RepID=UPI000A12188C|nr:phosphatase PAP2 family protein [Thermoactinospora rubra]
MHKRDIGRSLATSLLLVAAGAGALAWLAPGGLGDPDPVKVAAGASADLYRQATGHTLPEVLTERGAQAALAALGLLLAHLAWKAWRAGDRTRLLQAVVVALGTAAAYAVSEGLKLVVDEERPCRVVRVIAGCPPVGDWSFPSNHATLAAGLAAGLVLLRPVLAWLAVPLLVAVAALRVAGGAHYPHDVLAGAILGAVVVAALLLIVRTAAAHRARIQR